MNARSLQIRSPLSTPLETSVILFDMSDIYNQVVKYVIDLIQSHQEVEILDENTCLDLMQAIDYDVEVINAILTNFLKATYDSIVLSRHVDDFLMDLEIDLAKEFHELKVFKHNPADISKTVAVEIVSCIFSTHVYETLVHFLEDVQFDIPLSIINSFRVQTYRSVYSGSFYSDLKIYH